MKRTTDTQFSLSADPETLEFNDVVQLLVSDELYDEARAYRDQDFWQNRKGWIGPIVDEDEENAEQIWDEIQRGLVASPALDEVTERHVDAILGSESDWRVTVARALKPAKKGKRDPITGGLLEGETDDEAEQPTDQEQSLIDQATVALINWWDAKEALAQLWDAAMDVQLGGRGLLRLMVPEGELMEVDGEIIVPAGDLQESLDRVWPVAVEARQAVVLRDPVTMRDVGVYVYEVVDALSGKPTQIAELTYLDVDRNTVIRVIGQTQQPAGKSDPVDWGRTELPLGRRLTIYEMRSRPLVTRPILDNLKLLVMGLTMMGNNVVLAGYLERIFLGAQAPGEYVNDPKAPGGKRFVPDKFKTGARTTQFIKGAQKGVDKESKQPLLEKPDVKFRDPVDVKTFVDTQEAAYRNILHGTRQLHVIISGDAIASGESRKQARDDYEKSLKRTKSRVDAAGRWMLETALWMASVFMGQPGLFDGLKVLFDSQVDAGPLSAVDRAAIRGEVQAGLRSKKNAVVELRINEDPESELLEISQEDANDPVQTTNLATAQTNLERARQGTPPSGAGDNNMPPPAEDHGGPAR
jgi:hypothetical protein